jgi:hypothetical protein
MTHSLRRSSNRRECAARRRRRRQRRRGRQRRGDGGGHECSVQVEPPAGGGATRIHPDQAAVPACASSRTTTSGHQRRASEHLRGGRVRGPAVSGRTPWPGIGRRARRARRTTFPLATSFRLRDGREPTSAFDSQPSLGCSVSWLIASFSAASKPL